MKCVRVNAARAHAPSIADSDTGRLSNARHAALGDESASASAIQFEDQECPKIGGHLPGRQVFPVHDMVRKIKIVVEI